MSGRSPGCRFQGFFCDATALFANNVFSRIVGEDEGSVVAGRAYRARSRRDQLRRHRSHRGSRCDGSSPAESRRRGEHDGTTACDEPRATDAVALTHLAAENAHAGDPDASTAGADRNGHPAAANASRTDADMDRHSERVDPAGRQRLCLESRAQHDRLRRATSAARSERHRNRE